MALTQQADNDQFQGMAFTDNDFFQVFQDPFAKSAHIYHGMILLMQIF
jgi:hypothetical protein